jgi:hypothetical protein
VNALRALLCAVFGGFIGAAPAAPVVAGPGGAFTEAPQRSERPTCQGTERSDSTVAGAPPRAGGGAAAVVPAVAGLPPVPFVAAAPVLRGRSVPPPDENVRAGFLDLPPPAR